VVGEDEAASEVDLEAASVDKETGLQTQTLRTTIPVATRLVSRREQILTGSRSLVDEDLLLHPLRLVSTRVDPSEVVDEGSLAVLERTVKADEVEEEGDEVDVSDSSNRQLPSAIC
jgi:hypothetical protein